MKKLMVIFLALTLLTTFSVGYAKTTADSPEIKSCIICPADKDLAGTIFTVDKDVEKNQKYGY